MTDHQMIIDVPPGLRLQADVIRLSFHGDEAPSPPVVVRYPAAGTAPLDDGELDDWHVHVHSDADPVRLAFPGPDAAFADSASADPFALVVSGAARRVVTFLAPGSRLLWEFITAASLPLPAGVPQFSVETWGRRADADPRSPWAPGEPWAYLAFPRLQLTDAESVLPHHGATVTRFTAATVAAGGGWGSGAPDARLPEPVPPLAHSVLCVITTPPPHPTTAGRHRDDR